jgi:hypothetical protein
MSINHPKAGPNYVPAYQISGIPYVTSSLANEVECVSSAAAHVREPVIIEFPYVTKFVTIRNTGVNELRVGFSARGVFAIGERLPPGAGGASGDTKEADARIGNNYFLIPSASTSAPGEHGFVAESVQTFDIRCKKLVFLSNATSANPNSTTLSGSFSILAGLTSVLASEYPVLTGSNGFEGVG